MKRLVILLLAFAFINIGACSKPGPSLLISGVQIVAPAPGRSMASAYLTIQNRSDEPVTISGISSPQFRSVELHETVIENGIASMRPVPARTIEPNSTLILSPGGLHLMLAEPTSVFLPGTRVSLRIDFAQGDMLLVDSPLQTRVQIEEAS